jgi:hypothetical protein
LSSEKVRQVTELTPIPDPEVEKNEDYIPEYKLVKEVSGLVVEEVVTEIQEEKKTEEKPPIQTAEKKELEQDVKTDVNKVDDESKPTDEKLSAKKKPKASAKKNKKDDDDDDVPPEGPVQITLEL